MTFILFFVFLTALWSVVLEEERDTLRLLITSSFLSIVEISYIPQITSLLFSSLNAYLIVIFSLFIPLSCLVSRKTREIPISCKNIFYRFIKLKSQGMGEIQDSLFLRFLFFSFVVVFLYIFIYITILNRFGWDGEVYHSSAAAWYHQNNKITDLDEKITPWINAYPKNIELFSMMIFKLNGSDRYLESYQLLFFCIGLVVVYKVIFYFLQDKRLALIGAFVSLFHTFIIRQLISTYVDGTLFFLSAFSFYFLIVCTKNKFSLWSISLLGISLGFIAQTKGSGIHVGVVFLAVSTILLFFLGDIKNRIGKVFVLCLLTVLFGSGWWIKNYWVYGNPFYPYEVALGPFSFSGIKLDLNIHNIDFSIYQGANIFWLYTKFLLKTSVLYLVFGYLLIFFFIIKKSLEKEFLKVLLFFVPLVIFVVIPYSWIPRYGLILTLPAGIAFAWFLGWIDSSVLNVKIKRGVYLLSSLLLIIQIGDAFPPVHADEWKTGLNEIFLSKEGEKKVFHDRFDFFRSKKGVTIGIEQIRLYEDDPHWYQYWGHEWKNKILIVNRKEDLKKIDFFVYPVETSQFKKADLDKEFEYVMSDTLKERGQPELQLSVYKRFL